MNTLLAVQAVLPQDDRGDGLMIDDLEIQNFKCFQSVSVKGLAQINIIVGDNGSGKTALLEALYLVCGNTPENHVKAGGWRGLHPSGRVAVSHDTFNNGHPWRNLFRRFDDELPAIITTIGSPSRSLTVQRRTDIEESVPTSSSEAIESPIIFTWTDNEGKEFKCIPILTPDRGIQFPRQPAGIPGAMIPDIPVSPKESADRFSDLDIHGQATGIVERLHVQFPDIEALSVQSDLSTDSLLYASISGWTPKLPLDLFSGGVNRWVYVLCTIERFARGAVFIDEVDKGIYHQRLQSYWKSLVDSATHGRTQVFATTHSAEALAAALPIIKTDPSRFRLLRLERDGRGSVKIQGFKGDKLRSALESGFEIR